MTLPSTRPSDEGWDPGTVEANAERAVEDPTTIAYLGELDQGASAVSLPVTNREDILQVSPADGLTSLTRTPPGRPRAGPERYYPDGTRTFVRLVPPDLGAARKIVEALRERGSRRLAILHDDRIADRELEGMVLALSASATQREVTRIAIRATEPDEVADTVEETVAARPDALVYAGAAGPESGAVLAALASRLGDVPLWGGPPLASQRGVGSAPAGACAFTGVPQRAELDSRGRRLLGELRRRGGARVGGEALLGYEAMRLTLDAIEEGGPDRRRVARAARAAGERDGALGRYEIGAAGDVEGRSLPCVPLGEGAG